MKRYKYFYAKKHQLLLVRRAERSERPPLSAAVWRGTPPSSGPRWVTSPRLLSGVGPIFTAVLLLYGTDDLSSGREPRLLRSHRGLRYADVFPPPPARPAPGGMDLGRGGDVVLLRLRLRYVASQRGTSATPWRSSYGDTSSLRSLRARAGSYGQLFLLHVRQRGRHIDSQASFLPTSSSQLTAAAGNYAYANLRLWGVQTSPWRPAVDVISPYSLTLTYLSTHAFGTLAPLGQASKFITLLRLNHRWTSFFAYAVALPNVDLRR
jgi:hypothetical protein